MSEILFNYLIVGLDKLQRQSEQYPYPAELRLAMNNLAIILGDNYPKTFPTLFKLLHAPIGDWLPNAELPSPLEPESSLLYRGQLTDEADDYLTGKGLQNIANFGDIQSIQENQLMLNLLTEARQQYENNDAIAVENDYATARQFLIENPITTRQALVQKLRFNAYKSHIENMYDKVEDVQHLASKNGELLSCRECGPIHNVAFGQADSLKPTACKGRCPTETDWDTQAVTTNMFILKREIQKRTMIPGKAEIDLYKTMMKIMTRQKIQILKQVRLYPAVDRYDLQLRFEYSNRDGEMQEVVWAVDVKDYHKPQNLGNDIKPKLDEGIGKVFPNFLPNLKWHRAFYVVPDYREIANEGYCDILRGACESERFNELNIITSNEFIKSVEQLIWEHN